MSSDFNLVSMLLSYDITSAFLTDVLLSVVVVVVTKRRGSGQVDTGRN